MAEAIDPVVEAIDREDLVEARRAVEAIDPEDLGEARQAVETGAHLGVDPEGSTDRAHAPTAAEVPPAWVVVAAAVAAAAAAVAAAADGGGRHARRT